MPRRPGFKVMSIQFGEEVEDMKAMESSLSITAGGSLKLSNGFKLGLVGGNSGIQFSDITTTRELGRGASSKVLEGLHKPTGQQLAVKMLTNVHDKELRKQLKAELDFMKMINHAACPFLNQIYDAYFSDDAACLVVEFCANGPLDSALERAGPMPEPTLSFTVRSIFLGLNYLFQAAVLHRDMKPANCLITGEGVIKISDFGSSKKLGAGADEVDDSMMAVSLFQPPPTSKRLLHAQREDPHHAYTKSLHRCVQGATTGASRDAAGNRLRQRTRTRTLALPLILQSVCPDAAMVNPPSICATLLPSFCTTLLINPPSICNTLPAGNIYGNAALHVAGEAARRGLLVAGGCVERRAHHARVRLRPAPLHQLRRKVWLHGNDRVCKDVPDPSDAPGLSASVPLGSLDDVPASSDDSDGGVPAISPTLQLTYWTWCPANIPSFLLSLSCADAVLSHGPDPRLPTSIASQQTSSCSTVCRRTPVNAFRPSSWYSA